MASRNTTRNSKTTPSGAYFILSGYVWSLISSSASGYHKPRQLVFNPAMMQLTPIAATISAMTRVITLIPFGQASD
jgi:hypothetical protein